MTYVHLSASAALPELSALRPFRAVVILEETVDVRRRAAVCEALAAAGCLYLMAWGADCESWPEAMSQANRAAFDAGEIPSDALVISTWHGRESLPETFWFARHTAMHPCATLDNIVLLHFAPAAREAELLALYASD